MFLDGGKKVVVRDESLCREKGSLVSFSCSRSVLVLFKVSLSDFGISGR